MESYQVQSCRHNTGGWIQHSKMDSYVNYPHNIKGYEVIMFKNEIKKRIKTLKVLEYKTCLRMFGEISNLNDT